MEKWSILMSLINEKFRSRTLRKDIDENKEKIDKILNRGTNSWDLFEKINKLEERVEELYRQLYVEKRKNCKHESLTKEYQLDANVPYMLYQDCRYCNKSCVKKYNLKHEDDRKRIIENHEDDSALQFENFLNNLTKNIKYSKILHKAINDLKSKFYIKYARRLKDNDKK